MLIPYSELSATALTAIIEEYVTREGTEYGTQDFSLVAKVAQVRRQLQRGEVQINFDTETETCQLVVADADRGKHHPDE